jgi:hypothetical protein
MIGLSASPSPVPAATAARARPYGRRGTLDTVVDRIRPTANDSYDPPPHFGASRRSIDAAGATKPPRAASVAAASREWTWSFVRML